MESCSLADDQLFRAGEARIRFVSCVIECFLELYHQEHEQKERFLDKRR